MIQDLRLSAPDLAARFEQMQRDLDGADPANVRLDEFRIFTTSTGDRDEEFETSPESVHDVLASHFARIVRVARLREVRVVRGFTRINPPFDAESGEMSPISVAALEWLPAIEIRGEGIFLQLNGARLTAWEKRPEVIARVGPVARSWKIECDRRDPGQQPPFPASPRLLLIHSLSHALIRQLTLECGYSSASIRERLYVSEGADEMTGILIYTGTPDSDGTLGGLQRRAAPDLFGPTVVAAIRSIEWCSSDPLCLAGELAAPETHSVASCHSCMLVPETSCEYHNRFLDRALLIGSELDRSIGYFADLTGRNE